MSDNKQRSKEEALPAVDEETDNRETYDLLISQDKREKAEVEDADVDRELATDEFFATQHGEGHTYNAQQALDQGLTYTPPTDPPVLLGGDLQGAEVAAGFGLSMEDDGPSPEDLPPRLATNDLELQDLIELALRNNSETGHLTKVMVQVERGRVNLSGSVASEDDIARVYDIVKELEGVVRVQNNLQVEVN